jgi:hypothetical protein
VNTTLRVLVGYAVLYLAFDGAGRLLDALGLGPGKAAAAAVGITMAVLVETVLHGQLIEKSLVAKQNMPSGAARYRLLEPLRQYGLQHLRASGE